MAGKGKSVIVGLDIGTTKTCAVVGEWTDQGVSIIGIGSHPSEGLRRGVVVNIESTVEGIRRAVEEAGLRLHTVEPMSPGREVWWFIARKPWEHER